MNNTARTIGMSERLAYSVLGWLAFKAVALGWIDVQDAPYIVDGVFGAAGAAMVSYGWWVNRPSKLRADAASASTPSEMLTTAANTVPKNSELVIATTPRASPAEKREAHAIAQEASDKVVAKTTA